MSAKADVETIVQKPARITRGKSLSAEGYKMLKRNRQLIFLLVASFITNFAHSQGAKGAMSSGDKGYKLGCSIAQRPCENSCGELWSPSVKKEQERRCEEHKRLQRQECRKQAYDEHKTEGKRCSAIKDAYPSIDCYNANNKSLDKHLAACK